MDNSYPLYTGTSTHGSNDRTGVITSPISYSMPLSPSALDTPDRQTRRRNSWGRVPEGQDPLRITVPPPPATFDAAAAQAEDLQTSSPTSEDALTDGYLDDDPFANHHAVLQQQQQYHHPLHSSAETALEHAMMAGPSSVSLLPHHAHMHTVGHHAHMGSISSGLSLGLDGNAAVAETEDDEAHLTKNMAGVSGYSTNNGTWHDRDAEMLGQTAASTPANNGSTPNGRARRRTTIRISSSPAAALTKRTGTRLKTMSRSLRRMSLRVVNLAGAGLEDRIRLDDDDYVDIRDTGMVSPDDTPLDDDDDDDYDNEKDTVSFYDTRKSLPIRGRTLGLFGPHSAFRMSLFRFLVHPWTEPLILIMIILDAVVLTIQAAPDISLGGDANGPTASKGFFLGWEDYVIFILFCFFTVEALARICVSGFLLDPEVPLSRLFANPFRTSSSHDLTRSASLHETASVSRHGSLLQRSRSLRQRGLARVRSVFQNLAEPFELVSSNVPSSSSEYQQHSTLGKRSRSDTVQSAKAHTPLFEKAWSKVQDVHDHIRHPTSGHASGLSQAFRSEQSVIDGNSGKGDVIGLPFRLSVVAAQGKTHRNVPYLRQSWSRIDFVAVVSFWITFVLATLGVEESGTYHIGIFRAMSVMRTARLLAITSGTTTIMHSLKIARPLLASVSYFVVFAMALFSIIGIQSFQGSLLRSCYINPTLGESSIQTTQGCGGHVDPVSLNDTGYITSQGVQTYSPKGYICPLGQTCQESDQNPYNNVESFDTIYDALLQVVIVASSNGWSPLMYSMVDAEFFVSCFYFIAGIVILNFWLINLFVAVITNTFSAIRSTTKKSAFGAAPLTTTEEHDEGWDTASGRKLSRNQHWKDLMHTMRWVWVFLALASLVLQATGNANPSATHAEVLNWGEIAITVAFDIEIFLRFAVELPEWRDFFMYGHNWLDLVLAIGSSIIQLPAIKNSVVYRWLTIFQLARFYRVILEVPHMKPLLLAVFGNMYGLFSMTLFLFMINFIAALMAAQLMRGDIPSSIAINFGQIYNSFLGVYQIFTSENWTNSLYDVVSAEAGLGQLVIVIIFIAGWFLFANFILFQMFIAVINENFDVAEESKMGKQASDYWARTHDTHRPHASWLRKLNPYRWTKDAPVTVKVDNLPASLVLPMQKTLVEESFTSIGSRRARSVKAGGGKHYPSKSLTMLQRLFAGETASNDVPLAPIRHNRKASITTADMSLDSQDDLTERHWELVAAARADANALNIDEDAFERRAQKADFIRSHPSFDHTFWIFSQKNFVRQFCQKLVRPPNGERIFGTPPSPTLAPIFQLILLLTVLGGIVVESIATPTYRNQFFSERGLFRGAWFDIAECAFGLVLFVELIIKVIADGFIFTPNAYVRSIWNIIDFLILAGILVNVTTTLIFLGGLSRLTRSLKALRALRLITLIDIMRNTFQSLIISGASRILDAALLAILYMIPYAVWGLNIFQGLMKTCTDGNVDGLTTCVNEYVTTANGGNTPNTNSATAFGYLIPRVWDDPAPSTRFSFDTFRDSLLILFEIVSLEGWIDVMSFAMSITGHDQQPQTNASQVNAIFFVIYNLMGGVVILTIFVSIIIGNFRAKTGTAFLTQAQREWIDLQKLIKRQRSSRRPKTRPAGEIRGWCYDRAVHKRGTWSRVMTGVFLVHIVALLCQSFSYDNGVDEGLNYFFFAVTLIYIADIVIRALGLGWRSFKANGWNLFDVIVALGSFSTTLIVIFGDAGFVTQQLQKLFVTSIAFKLVQKTDSLNKLFKTSVASLPSILSLLGLWLILFAFFAILYMEVFGLTKWESAETRNENYSTMGSALVMLAFMTTGEGWNQYMHDYTLEYPRCTLATTANGLSDCGSMAWALTLFIAWNLLSMYIFTNMFTGAVVDSFSYVFQTTTNSKTISREEMRAFKKIWAEYSNPDTGFLEKDRFVAFFGKLRGVFEVKIYPDAHSIQNIVTRCKPDEDTKHVSSTVIEDVDVKALKQALDEIDYVAIRKRRNLYAHIYTEAMISYNKTKGISFTNMLLLLAHHKLIVDRDALVLKDLIVRNETNKLVSDLVNVERVSSMLKMVSLRRRFLAKREIVRAAAQGIPAITFDVESMPSTPISVDIASSQRDSSGTPLGSPTPSPRNSRQFSPEMSLSLDTGASTLQRSRRISDISMLSADLASRISRDSSPTIDQDPEHIVTSMQNSLWGEMMTQAEEEDSYS